MPEEAPHPLTCKKGRRVHLADDDALEPFTCAICYEVLFDPVATTCNHVFCRECLKRWLETSPTPKCPLDNNQISARMKLPSFSFLVAYNALEVKCIYTPFGCSEVCRQDEIMGHEEDCGHKWTRCELCRKFYGTWLDVEDHENDLCPQRVETCRLCWQQFPAQNLEVHKFGCGQEMTTCDCGLHMPKGELARHQSHGCRLTVLVCLHCSETMAPLDAPKHTCKPPPTFKFPDGIFKMQKVKNGGKKKRRKGGEEAEGEEEGESENGKIGTEKGDWEDVEDEEENMANRVSKYIRELEQNLKKKAKDCKRLSRNAAETKAENTFLAHELEEMCEAVEMLGQELEKYRNLELAQKTENNQNGNQPGVQNERPKEERDLEPIGGVRWRSGVVSVALCQQTLLVSFLVGVAMVMLWHVPYGWVVAMGMVVLALPRRFTVEDGWLVIG